MKFEKLNDAKIKIIVSSHDMEEKNISVRNLFSEQRI